jgi:hypothetical protein
MKCTGIQDICNRWSSESSKPDSMKIIDIIPDIIRDLIKKEGGE